jgi:hypothetical protein
MELPIIALYKICEGSAKRFNIYGHYRYMDSIGFVPTQIYLVNFIRWTTGAGGD